MTEKLANFLEIFNDINKTAIMMLIMIIGGIFRIKGYIDSQGLVDLLKTCTVSFFATTTVTNFTGMLQNHLSSKVGKTITNAISKEIHNES